MAQEKRSEQSVGSVENMTNRQFREMVSGAIGDRRAFKPTHLAIEVTNACNADCIMCPYSSQTRLKGVMKAGEHALIIDKMKAWDAPVNMITHAGLGDPLLDKRLEDKLVYEKSIFPNAQVIVYTNGGLLDEARARRLLASPVDVVSFSVNGFRKETYEEVMKIPRDATYANIERFNALRREQPRRVRMAVSLVKTDLCSPEEIREFVEYWRGKVDDVILPPWISWGDYFEKDANQDEEHVPCFYIWKTMMIDHDGTVKMCCEDYDSKYKMGNILEQDPNEIFNSARMMRQRSDQLRGDFSAPKICNGCSEAKTSARGFWLQAVLHPTTPPVCVGGLAAAE